MHTRLKVLFVSATLVAAFGSGVAHAAVAVPSPDPATATAIAKWRANALALVPAVFQDVVAGSYADQVTTTDTEWFGKAMVARQVAEQTAFGQLDSASVALIESYYQSVQEAMGIGSSSS